jgi:quercetin dioxygenase-like cupin family protein
VPRAAARPLGYDAPMPMVLDEGNIRLEVVKSGRDTGGELLEFLATYRPGSLPPPRHYHPSQVETFEVRRGALWFEVDGVERTVRAGESIVVPAGGVHRAKNASATEEAQVTWQTRPALRSLAFFEAAYALSKSGAGRLAKAALAREFSAEFVLASPPRVVQACVFGLLAPLARMLGKMPVHGERL